MKKYLLIFILLAVFKNTYSQCVTTYGTINYTSCILNGGYYFDGNLLESSGTYTETLTNYKGCDSIVTLYLTIYQENEGSANISICENKLPYLYDGQYVWEGYNEIDLPPSYPNGCDSLVEVFVTSLPSATSNTNKTICSSQLPYNWNGQIITEGGYYNANIVTPNPNDCDSLAQLNLIVNAAPSSTTNTTVCGNKLPYVWNGKSYTATGTYTMDFPNGTQCDSIATLNLTVKPVSTVTSISPTTASRGQSIVITGTNFQDASAVTIGGSPAQYFEVESPTSIFATVGTAVSGTITVTTGCTVDSLAGFTYNTNPGNIGIGTKNATSKLTISGGDLQLTDIGGGIILKSPDGTCWKLYMGTVEEGLNGLHIVQVPCP